MISREPLVMPEKKRIHYNGTNKGDLVGFVSLPEWESTWALTFDDKKKLYGKHRVAVGGPTGDDDDDDEDVDMGQPDDADTPPTVATPSSTTVTTAPTGRLGSNVEPVLYQAMPVEFYDDLMSSCFLSDVIHLTAGDGAAAKAALIRRVNFFGVCLSENHVEQLYTHLTDWMLKQFGEPSSAFYQPSMNKKRPAPSADAGANPTPTGAGGAGGAAGGKPKKAKKTAKAKKESSSSSSDSASGAD